MIRILIGTIFLSALGLGLPIDPPTKIHEKSLDEVVLIPYQVTFIPVEVSLNPKKNSSKNPQNLLILKNINYEDATTDHSKTEEPTIGNEREASFDLFKESFNEDLPTSAEDFVLVPISTLKQLEDGSLPHSVTKRQAPGRDFGSSGINSKYRPRFALVGYLNSYDDFPTLS